MSRTVRKKHIERSLLRQTEFFHEFGFYGQRFWESGVYNVNDHWVIQYRQMTKDERFKKWKEYHGESKDSNDRTPSRFYRQMYEKRLRTYNNKQLRKTIAKQCFDDSVFYNTPASHKWAWD